MSQFTVTIAKEYLKFSAAHFTIFDDSSVELLHGHNYYASLRLVCRDNDQSMTVEFRSLKKIMQGLCQQWDEKVLLPTDSPYVRISKNENAFDVTFQGAGFSKHYRFPCEDVELLPVSNITSELLAKTLCGAFRKKLERVWDGSKFGPIETAIVGYEIEIEETRGQSVGYRWDY